MKFLGFNGTFVNPDRSRTGFRNFVINRELISAIFVAGNDRCCLKVGFTDAVFYIEDEASVEEITDFVFHPHADRTLSAYLKRIRAKAVTV